MTRSVSEWQGKTANTAIPPRVRARVFLAARGHCQHCTRKISPGDQWQCDHIKALVNGGQNRETNLQCLCDWCHSEKTAGDVAEKATIARKRNKHIGLKARKRKIPYRRFNGDPVWPD